ncbi:hypothetical protein GCM10009863_55230 [Streptomyces axinellae]|uniref:ATP-binding protein n=1 Tax=Streptomyces axinellae TaxID=552788 RepID=A0ABN3QPW1_9ACTN
MRSYACAKACAHVSASIMSAYATHRHRAYVRTALLGHPAWSPSGAPARLHQLDDRGIRYGSGPSENVAAVVAELAANAVVHGHVPGRDFELALSCPEPLS